MSTTARKRLTHFICLPLHQTPTSITNLATLGRKLLDSSPQIPGLDPSIVIAPQRLHLTLGVMSLESPSRHSRVRSGENPGHTLEDALAHLQSLALPISKIIIRGDLCINFSCLDVMKPARGSAKEGEAHVLWVGPEGSQDDDEKNKTVYNVCNLIHSSFKSAGIIEPEGRPLKLHCTLVNSVYRKRERRGSSENKRNRNDRLSFSYSAIQSSDAVQAILTEPRPESTTARPNRGKTTSLQVDMGSYRLSELQLCEMGSYDEYGRYRSVGSIPL